MNRPHLTMSDKKGAKRRSGDPKASAEKRRKAAVPEEEEEEKDDGGDDGETREEIVLRLRSAAAAATAADLDAIAPALRAEFLREVEESIDDGACTDALYDMADRTPALVRAPLDRGGGTAVERCCERGDATARGVAETLLELGADATADAYAIILEALREKRGGGGDFFDVLARGGSLPRTLGGRPTLDVLAEVPDEYFLECILPEVVRRVSGAMTADEAAKLTDFERANAKRLPALADLRAPDGPFARKFET